MPVCIQICFGSMGFVANYFVSLMSSCLKSDMLALESSWRNQDKK